MTRIATLMRGIQLGAVPPCRTLRSPSPVLRRSGSDHQRSGTPRSKVEGKRAARRYKPLPAWVVVCWAAAGPQGRGARCETAEPLVAVRGVDVVDAPVGPVLVGLVEVGGRLPTRIWLGSI